MIKGIIVGAVFVAGLFIGNQFFDKGKIYKTLENGSKTAINWVDDRVDVDIKTK